MTVFDILIRLLSPKFIYSVARAAFFAMPAMYLIIKCERILLSIQSCCPFIAKSKEPVRVGRSIS